MKSISPSNSEPATGRQYWRSLDELAETPEFREWIEREFPQGASEFNDPVSRRHFVKIMSASFMLAGLGIGATGCRRPVEKLEPFGKQPDDYVFGTSQLLRDSDADGVTAQFRWWSNRMKAGRSKSKATRNSPAAMAARIVGLRLRSSTFTIPTARGDSQKAGIMFRARKHSISSASSRRSSRRTRAKDWRS